jgi:hypothetical protein
MVVVHVQAAQSGGRLGAWESEETLGDRLPLHVHTREHEQVVLLEGTITFWVGDQVHHLAGQLGVQIVGPPPAVDAAS